METGYEKEYSDDGFWNKVKRYAQAAGKEVIEKALWLYYVMNDPKAPAWAKATAAAALGYFIFPLDAIPDVTPMVGYADDLGVLAAAIAALAMNITPEIKRMAKEKLREWFPQDDGDPEATAKT